ncbi:hypothetical protein [uncultured Kocuria sp.]|uniref:hypothetical protein n=1 Tax=uncultured Kocuria sp. TaxID=259305 RepID=UPI00262D9C0C|nr:hypothetical protein [uncultured Kocuria sp.]
MSGTAPVSAAALEPVRRTLREAAQREAADILEGAARQARELEDAARTEAAGILAAAAAEGEAAARAEAARRSARVRRQAHELVLAQQNALRQDLQRRLREAAVALRTDPRYPELRERLREQCRQVLGPAATVRESPEGGVVAETGTRSLDLSLPVLAALVFESAPEASSLWRR